MTNEKFKNEINTLIKFFTIYCKDKHNNQSIQKQDIYYKNSNFLFDTNFCDECNTLFNYSIKKLQNCPHEIKPRCRNCPNPCYDKNQWKALAKIMKYSAIKLGVSKIKQRVKKLFTR